MIRWAWLTGSVETVGLRPGGITSPICPEISSPSFWNLRARDGDFCSSSSTWLPVLQTWSTPPPPPPPLLSIVCCAHKSVTSHKHGILHFYCISNKRCLFLHKTVSLVTQGKAEMCVFLFFFVFLGWFGIVLFSCQPRVFCDNTVSFKDTCTLWTSACVFTFMVFNIHCCLGLQQQRDQLLVSTQSSMVQWRQPSHRHRLCIKIHIFIDVV